MFFPSCFCLFAFRGNVQGGSRKRLRQHNKNQESINKNRAIRDRVKTEKLSFTPFGIVQKA